MSYSQRTVTPLHVVVYLLCALALAAIALRDPLLRALDPAAAVALELHSSPPEHMKRYRDPWGREGDWKIEPDVDSVAGKCQTRGPDGELGTDDDVSFDWYLSMLGGRMRVETERVWNGPPGATPPGALQPSDPWIKCLAAPRAPLAAALFLLTLWWLHAPWLRSPRRSRWAELGLHVLHLSPFAALFAYALRQSADLLSDPWQGWSLVSPAVSAWLGGVLGASLVLAATRYTLRASPAAKEGPSDQPPGPPPS